MSNLKEITQDDLIKEVSETVTKQTGQRISPNDTELIINNFLDKIVEHVSNNERVNIKSFGRFDRQKRSKNLFQKPSLSVDKIEWNDAPHFKPIFTPRKHFLDTLDAKAQQNKR